MGKRILILLGGVLVIIAVLFLLYFAFISIGGEEAKKWMENNWEHFQVLLSENGPLLFLSIAILPGFVLPVAPLLGFAGIWGGENGPILSCIYCTIALLTNLCWTYWLAKGPARNIIQKFLSKSRFQLPDSPPENMTEWALILRLTPGVPFIFSNYGLGLIGMNFVSYLLISVPIISITACGYVLAFAGLFGGEWKYLWSGGCIIAISVIIGRLVIKKKRAHAN